MSFFDSALDVAGDWMPVVEMGTQIYSAYSSARANDKASDAMRAGYARSNELTQAELAKIREATAPAITQQRQVVAQDPYQLRPEQRRELEDVRRSARRTVASGPLAGSGRAQVRAFNEMEGDTRDRMIRQNVQRTDSAASRLAGIGFDAGAASGRIAGQTAEDIARVGAEKTLANQQVTSNALGDIMSYINDYDKKRNTGVSQSIGGETV